MINRGEDVDQRRFDGVTPLMMAASRGHIEVVQYLLERGADPTLEDASGHTALYHARAWKQRDVVEVLNDFISKKERREAERRKAEARREAERREVEAKRETERKVAEAKRQAEEQDRVAALKAEEERREAERREAEAKKEAERQARNAALLVAAGNGDAAAVREKLDQGAEINGVYANGVTALILAAENGHREVVTLLLERGADAKTQDQQGRDALMLAAYKGHVPVVQLLLDKGGDVNRSDATSFTPLILASEEGHAAMVKLLLERGAGVKAKDRDDRTALIVAAGKGYLAVVKLLLDRGSPLEAKDKSGYTALMVAALNGHVPVVQALLDEGADVLATNPDGDTAMRLAQQRGQTQVVQLLKPIEAKRRALVEMMPVPPSGQQAGVSASLEDVDNPPPALVPVNPHLHAVVIGVENYRNKLPKAEYAAHDAETVRAYLTRTLGYPEENVAVLLNEHASKSDLEKYVETWLPNRVEKNDTVFVYFSGHGTPNPKTGEAYLVPYDGDPSFLDKTGYPLKRLYDHLAALPARQVVVMLDSCFSGAGGRSVLAKGAKPMVLVVENTMVAGGSTVVLAASSGEQVSNSFEAKKHGLFTYFVLKGLQGEADRNHDGTIELLELFEFVKTHVARFARRKFNSEQVPQLFGLPDQIEQVRLLEQRAP
ncbi:MAG: ankyrin repeat domain-containing protein [Nitrospirae bacterium]|nr:ankyrin repeat domain-containing protein [Nitrospirota bacterium]